MMNLPSSELADLLGRCQAGITALLRQTVSRPERAARLADLLRQLAPQASLTACLLHGDNPNFLAVRPEDDSFSPEWKERLREQLGQLDPLGSGVQELPTAAGQGVRTLVAAIHEDGRSRGFLAIGLPSGASAEEGARAEYLLTMCAPALAMRWALETVRGEQAELAKFALLGQAFVGLAHELNNALNSMMLQTSVVQLRVDAQARNDLVAIRQHGAQAAALVRSLQHVVQERREKSYAVDLNAVLTDVLEEAPALRQRVSLQLAAQAPLIRSTRGAVKQLVVLLLEGLLAGTKSAVRLQTEKSAGGAALSAEIAEASTAEGENGPTAQTILWQHLDEVGRHAGQSLLRQLDGTLTVEPDGKGGGVVRIEWGGTTEARSS